MRLIKVLVIAFWLTMMGMLVYFELLHGVIGYKQLTYLDLIPKDLILEDNWMGVYFKGAKIGYMQTHLAVPEGKKVSEFRMRNCTFLRLPLLGKVEPVRFNAEARIDAGYRLKQFNLDLESAHYSTRLEGEFNQKGDVVVWMVAQGKRKKLTELNLPAEAIFYSPFTPIPLGKLLANKKFSIQFFDPISLGLEKVFIEPAGAEQLTLLGKSFAAHKLRIRYKGIESLAWVTPEGELLKEETPLGWAIVKERPEQIFSFMKDEPKVMVELIDSVSLPSNVTIPNPAEVRSLKALLKGYTLELKNLDGPGQKILAVGKDGILLSINSVEPPPQPPFLPIKDEKLAPFLEPSIFVQSEDAQIMQTGRQIVGEERQSWKAAILLNRWVYQKVQKVPAVSIPSSIEVLHQMQGDCNEHTFLYAALARSVGLPTRIVYGLVYQQDSFFYHAWPQVFAGRWVNLDPTLGQDIACATHIKLLEGDIKEQLNLVNIIGKLGIEIKEYR